MDNEITWEERFNWLLENCTGGFGTPDGWYGGFENLPGEKEWVLEKIDKSIVERRKVA